MLATNARRPARLSETMRRGGLEEVGAEKKLPAPAHPVERPQPAPHRRILRGTGIQREGRRGVLGIQAWIRLRSIKQWPKPPLFRKVPRGVAFACYHARRRQLASHPRSALKSGFLEAVADAVQGFDHFEIVVHH